MFNAITGNFIRYRLYGNNLYLKLLTSLKNLRGRATYYSTSILELYFRQIIRLALTHVWPENCVVLLKSSLRFVPGFNVCAYLCEAIFINRFNRVDAHKSIEQAINAVRNHRKIWIFPEGTRNTSGTMLPFKKGAFIIAREINADYIFNYGGRVIIEILPAIDPLAYSDIDSLTEECYKQMENQNPWATNCPIEMFCSNYNSYNYSTIMHAPSFAE
ncbi:unnamed protein product [Onchocerca ochengi]|uniref:1-acylglycerol-3-phosphate O-acyltransferase n=1 Tax=Onchocerca ochengi TaxID=42157 RepID=A0A182ELC7_ONCOC|nr:unnamed protein product [Onchocerca ochengi]